MDIREILHHQAQLLTDINFCEINRGEGLKTMKRNFLRYASLIIVSWVFISYSFADADQAGSLLGITWGDSKLVSFDPYTGTITQVHAYLNPNEAFLGLTYDRNRNKLYALAEGSNNLYTIDPVTLDIALTGTLNIDPSTSWGYDAGALAYDPITDSLYTAIEHWQDDYSFINSWSEISKIDLTTARLTVIGNIYGSLIGSFDYNSQDGSLYGLAASGSGMLWDPYNTSLVRINPSNAAMETIFISPYDVMLGFTKNPNDNSYIYYSWINSTSHFYGEVNMDTGVITQLGNSDNVDVPSAMVYKSFPVSSLEPANDLVKFRLIKSTFETTPDVTGCPQDVWSTEPYIPYTGKLTFEAELKNTGKKQLTGLLLNVTDLAEGSVILNAYGGDLNAYGNEGGVGSILTVPKQDDYSDGILSRMDSVRFPMVICYTQRKPFRLSVDILAVVNPTSKHKLF
jgi:hypothetical protein